MPLVLFSNFWGTRTAFYFYFFFFLKFGSKFFSDGYKIRNWEEKMVLKTIKVTINCGIPIKYFFVMFVSYYMDYERSEKLSFLNIYCTIEVIQDLLVCSCFDSLAPFILCIYNYLLTILLHFKKLAVVGFK